MTNRFNDMLKAVLGKSVFTEDPLAAAAARHDMEVRRRAAQFVAPESPPLTENKPIEPGEDRVTQIWRYGQMARAIRHTLETASEDHGKGHMKDAGQGVASALVQSRDLVQLLTALNDEYRTR